jgi:adenine-specific DNA-methyltransferase
MTNPPYVSYGSRNQPKPSPSTVLYLRAEFPSSSEYKLRLHSMFQELAVRCTKDGGKIALLIPDTFLTGSYYSKLRSMLLENVRIESITECADALIPATVGRWCIPVYRRQYEKARPNPPAIKVNRIAKNFTVEQSNDVPADVFVSPDRSRFRLLFTPQDVAIFRKLDCMPPLSTIMRGHTGMRSRVGQKALISQSCVSPDFRRGLTSGASVRPHRVQWGGDWLNVRKELLFAGGFDPKIVERPKILVRQTGDRLIAAYDDSGFYHLNNVHSFAPVNGHPNATLLFLSGLFNSSFWLYIYQLKTREENRALAQVDIETVENMPLPHQRGDFELRIAELVQGMMNQPQPLEGRERAIDWLVYQLYNLDEQEIEYIESYVRYRRAKYEQSTV